MVSRELGHSGHFFWGGVAPLLPMVPVFLCPTCLLAASCIRTCWASGLPSPRENHLEQHIACPRCPQDHTAGLCSLG